MAADSLEEMHCHQHLLDVGENANVPDVYLLVPDRLEFFLDKLHQLTVGLISERAEHPRQHLTPIRKRLGAELFAAERDFFNSVWKQLAEWACKVARQTS